MFRNRTEAGELLAERLQREGVEADIVLGVPRGGLPVARPVADALGVPLDIVAAKKMGAPGNPEYAIGAAASDGSVYRNEGAIERTNAGEAYVERARTDAAETAAEKEETYRQGEAPDLAGKCVVLVDDGVATGATLIACLRLLRGKGAAYVTVAVPVASPGSLDKLASEADETIALEEPLRFQAVGQFYETFDQVEDEEAIDYLRGN